MSLNLQTSPTNANTLRFLRNVVLKALVLFILANLIFAICYPLPELGRISAYNHIFPGRARLPYSENPQQSYNLSLYNLQAMFASHQLSGMQKPTGEYRVILIGDSSTWGFLLPVEQTLSSSLNDLNLQLPDGRQVRAYNLGYPVMSLTKDLMILSFAQDYQPDLIIWPVTLESFPYDKQLFPPLLQNNPEPVKKLIETYNLKLDPYAPEWVTPSLWDRTIIGARRPLADLLRLQFYGVMWAATGIDQDIPETYTPRQEDLSADESFHNLTPPHLQASDLALDVLAAGVELAGETPVLIINEPMFVSHGANSHIRYNFFYPRWAYDDYRQILQQKSASNGWHYIDLWDAVANPEFTNSAVHMTPAGTAQFAQHVAESILALVQSTLTR
ncbi:MAG: hypothetical protein AB1894_12055 [Chloroflexota bacterium]